LQQASGKGLDPDSLVLTYDDRAVLDGNGNE